MNNDNQDPGLRDVAEALAKPAPSFYERLFMRAYHIELTQTRADDGVTLLTTSRLVPKDDDLVLAYRTMILMRNTLSLCARQFKTYGLSEQHRRETEHLSLVENINLKQSEDRNLGVAGIIEQLLKDTPQLAATEWQPIATAPQDGKPIRLLGRMESGQAYVETGRWANIVWSVQQIPGHLPPTHWMQLEALPEEF